MSILRMMSKHFDKEATKALMSLACGLSGIFMLVVAFFTAIGGEPMTSLACSAYAYVVFSNQKD